MEVPEMKGKTESHTTSAVAFVEGGIQEAFDDACSICLEDFCERDPATVTNCKHEFHLQCILEWCQRSSQCPMCWQPISLKDATSQELLDAVVLERSLRVTPSRNAVIFHYPALGDFEFQHLPIGVNDADIEERILQRLAAATALRRAQHLGQREDRRTRPFAHGRPRVLVFSTQPSAPPSGPDSAAGGGNEPAAIPVGSPSTPLTYDGDEASPSQQIPHFRAQGSSLTPGSSVMATNLQGIYSNDRRSTAHSTTANQDRAGPSEFQSFSDSLRSRFNAVSLRYKESISKGTRGWKERLLSGNSSVSEIGSEVRRELNAKIASVSRLMERLETRENNQAAGTSLSIAETSNQNNEAPRGENSLHDNNTPATCSASSDSN
ncbi:E3 ubiquitin-protein ligase RHF2A-like [Gastrolobium bilobum]|uniref:E3 ubiquitin-protein ligase RHF2A-like n=1 Tax=Gastrolobium bilobum TaxID=150636 RepID=UPI002AB010DC|nr:E3 ubiquitin-protein ligase RHF2A-like [Gastrolobium bilobum]